MRFRHACSFFRSFPAPHAPSPAVPYDLTTARELTRTPQPHYNILQMIEEELVDKSMRSGRSYHRIVENVFFFVGTILVHEARWPRTCSRPCAFGKKTKKKTRKNPGAPKTHHEINPQQPGDRDHLETACGETRPTAYPILCLLYTSPSPRDRQKPRMPSSA